MLSLQHTSLDIMMIRTKAHFDESNFLCVRTNSLYIVSARSGTGCSITKDCTTLRVLRFYLDFFRENVGLSMSRAQCYAWPCPDSSRKSLHCCQPVINKCGWRQNRAVSWIEIICAAVALNRLFSTNCSTRNIFL